MRDQRRAGEDRPGLDVAGRPGRRVRRAGQPDLVRHPDRRGHQHAGEDRQPAEQRRGPRGQAPLARHRQGADAPRQPAGQRRERRGDGQSPRRTRTRRPSTASGRLIMPAAADRDPARRPRRRTIRAWSVSGTIPARRRSSPAASESRVELFGSRDRGERRPPCGCWRRATRRRSTSRRRTFGPGLLRDSAARPSICEFKGIARYLDAADADRRGRRGRLELSGRRSPPTRRCAITSRSTPAGWRPPGSTTSGCRPQESDFDGGWITSRDRRAVQGPRPARSAGDQASASRASAPHEQRRPRGP